ncbi:MAG: S8 family serine peptidase, partial [Bacteroidota bacterium]
MNIFTSKTLPIIVLFFLVTNLKAQTETEREAIQASTKVESLKTLSAERAATFQKNKQEALRLARENNWITEKSFDGGKIELMGVTPDGKPLYYTTHNADAAESVSTNEVYSGGAAGLSLDGTNMIAGEWDGGDVLTTHQEFTNTGTSRVTDMDGSSGISNHATHVAGTILAGGVQNSAKGMAYNAELYAYDWDADESEMADAAAGGLL